MSPQGGTITRGDYRPEEWRFPVRIETVCEKCGRDLIFWREAGQNFDIVVRCNGPDRPACSAIRVEENHRRFPPKPKKAPPPPRVRKPTLAQRHLARRWTCPRPDKRAHESEEAAEGRVLVMKATWPQSTTYLRHYLCDCTFWHIGNLKE